jgi:hypothetical protein
VLLANETEPAEDAVTVYEPLKPLGVTPEIVTVLPTGIA